MSFHQGQIVHLRGKFRYENIVLISRILVVLARSRGKQISVELSMLLSLQGVQFVNYIGLLRNPIVRFDEVSCQASETIWIVMGTSAVTSFSAFVLVVASHHMR